MTRFAIVPARSVYARLSPRIKSYLAAAMFGLVMAAASMTPAAAQTSNTEPYNID